MEALAVWELSLYEMDRVMSSKSWTRLFAFHIMLIPLGKIQILLFSLQLWVNSRAHWAL